MSWSDSESRGISVHSVSSYVDVLSAVFSESVVLTVLTSMSDSSKIAFSSLFEALILLLVKLIGSSITMLAFR